MSDEAMTHADEFRELAASLEPLATTEAEEATSRLYLALEEIAESWSGSNVGYHSRVYYKDFKAPPAGESWSTEWGRGGMFGSSNQWEERSSAEVKSRLLDAAGNPDLKELKNRAGEVRQMVEEAQAHVSSIFTASASDSYLDSIRKSVDQLPMPTEDDIRRFFPSQFKQLVTRDPQVEMKILMAPHQELAATVTEITAPSAAAKQLIKLLNRAAAHLYRLAPAKPSPSTSPTPGKKVFIGHGQSHDWRILKDFVVDRAHLEYDEFNRVAVAGIATSARLGEMLDTAAIAFLVLTAEDERADGSITARQNVIHEVGLFQGRLGWDRAIVVLEEGCEEFSNIAGLGQVRFPAGKIESKFEEIRLILEREGLL